MTPGSSRLQRLLKLISMMTFLWASRKPCSGVTTVALSVQECDYGTEAVKPCRAEGEAKVSLFSMQYCWCFQNDCIVGSAAVSGEERCDNCGNSQPNLHSSGKELFNF